MQEADFRKAVVVQDKYEITVQHTLAVFDFSKTPLDGVYKTIIFDLKHGVIVTKRSSKCVMNSIYYNLALGGQYFQKEIKNHLNHKYLNVISLGYYAFFSLKAHSNCNTHWIAMHHVRKYKHYPQEEIVKFSYAGIDAYKITFNEVKSHIHERIAKSICHNRTVMKLVEHQLREKWDLEHLPRNSHTKKSILYRCEHNHRFLLPCKIVEEMLNHYIRRAHRNAQEEFGMDKDIEYEKSVIRKIKRNRYNH